MESLELAEVQGSARDNEGIVVVVLVSFVYFASPGPCYFMLLLYVKSCRSDFLEDHGACHVSMSAVL